MGATQGSASGVDNGKDSVRNKGQEEAIQPLPHLPEVYADDKGARAPEECL